MKSSGFYVDMLNEKFSWIANSCIHFGPLPNRSEIDLDSFKKVEEAIKTRSLCHYKGHKHLLYLLNFLIGVTFMLQDRKEYKNLTWSHIRFSTVTPDGKVSNLKDKKRHVIVKNPTHHDSSSHMDAVESINNKYTCIVYWVNYYWLICLPDQHWFYCYAEWNKKTVNLSAHITTILSQLIFFYIIIFFKEYKKNTILHIRLASSFVLVVKFFLLGW